MEWEEEREESKSLIMQLLSQVEVMMEVEICAVKLF